MTEEVRKKNRRVVKGGDIVAAGRGSLHVGDGEGNNFVRRLITTTNTFFILKLDSTVAKIIIDMTVTSTAAQKYYIEDR